MRALRDANHPTAVGATIIAHIMLVEPNIGLRRFHVHGR
jgi:hypothetical protein